MNSLRERILLWTIVGLMAALLASGAGVYWIAGRDLRSRLDSELLARLRTFSSMVVEEWPDAENPDRPRGAHLDYEGPLDAAHLGVMIRITTPEGQSIAVSPDWPAREWTETAPARLNAPPTIGDARSLDDRAWRIARVRIESIREEDDPLLPPEAASTPRPQALVEVAVPTTSVSDALAALTIALIVGGALAVGGTSLAVWLGVVRGLVPLGRLRRAMDGVSAESLRGLPPDEPYPEELRPVVAALRSLVERVSSAMDRERRFTDAAAHELRTPIAELRALADVADRWPEPDRLRKAIRETRGVADEMASLIESLLTVARGSGAFSDGAAEDIGLVHAAREVIASREASHAPRDVGVLIAGDETACWRGPRAAVTAVLRNLIDNAIEYTPDGGCVRVSISAAARGGQLEIENEPVRITPAQLERLFEPFWRADASGSDRVHRGLGLSIVASLAGSMGLVYEASLPRDGVLRIVLRPRAAR